MTRTQVTFRSIEDVKPVSYTHLDVYKRQECSVVPVAVAVAYAVSNAIGAQIPQLPMRPGSVKKGIEENQGK